MSVDDLRRTLIVALLLGATATGAAAWERPKAPPSPKVEACPGMGEGFVRIPGSETCVRLSGSVRVEASHVGGGAAYDPDGR